MLYDSYKKKILKWVNVRDYVIKHKIMFICIILAIIALCATLLAFKGTITSPITVNEETVYGEKLNCKSSAFLAFTGYEYKPKDGQKWSEKVPTAPGEYEVRAFALKAFGGRNYTESAKFKIAKKDVVICAQESEIAYGDEPTFSGDLSFNDYVDERLLLVSSRELFENKKAFTADLNSIIIRNSDDKNVTNCYNITTKEKQITILQREITITTQGGEKEYDGKPLLNYNYSVTSGSVAPGDTLNIALKTSITQVGTVKNTPTINIFNSKIADVTKFYKITLNEGDLTVKPRKLVIKTQSAEKVYDGLPISAPDFTIVGGSVLQGDILTASPFEIVGAGEAENRLDFSVYNSYGFVTSNYQIEQECGTLKITPKPVTVTTSSFVGTYNGYDQNSTDFVISDLAKSENANVDSFASIKNVGTVDNILSIGIYRGSENTTANYLFTYNYGTLTIKQASITVKPKDITSVYDGKPLSSTAVEVVSGTVMGADALFIQTNGSQISVGSCENVITKVSIFNSGEDVTYNYIVETLSGKLTVTARDISIKPKDINKIYDGTLAEPNEVECTSDFKLVEGHSIECDFSGSLMEIGRVETRIESFVITDANGIDVTDFYNVTTSNGYIMITKRLLKIKPEDKVVTYDGTTHTADSFEVLESQLMDGHEVKVEFVGSQTVAGVNDQIGFAWVKIISGNTDYTDYYNITTEKGKIIVNKRHIGVLTGSLSVVYDGAPHEFSDMDYVNESDLAVGDDYIITHRAMPVLVGTYTNSVVLKMYSENGEDRTSSYIVDSDFGSIKIERRVVEIQIFGATEVYSAQPIYNCQYSVVGENGIVYSDNVTVTEFAQITDVGSVPNFLKFKVSSFTYGDVTDCYQFNFVNTAELTVLKRDVEVEFYATSKVYDNLPFGGDATAVNFKVTSGSLASFTHTVVAEIGNNQTNVGTFNAYVLSAKILSDINQEGAPVDVTQNYNFTFNQPGLGVEFTILKREIVIGPNNESKSYDGKPLIPRDCSVFSAIRLVENHYLVTSVSGSQTEVGSSKSQITDYDIMENGQSVLDNYAVTLMEGTLTVTKAVITVKTPSDTFSYDGREHYSYYGYSVSGLPNGFDFEVDTYQIVKNVGVYENFLTGKIYLNGVDKTNSFTVRKNFGTLTVKALKVEVSTESLLGVIYDGREHSNPSYRIINQSSIRRKLSYNLKITLESSMTTALVGSWDNTIRLKFTNTNTGEDVSSNFSMTYTQNGLGVIEILPLDITVTTNSSSKVFDGLPLYDEGFALNGELADGDQITVESRTELNKIGTCENVLGLKVYAGGNLGDDRTSCYNITMIYGTLKVDIADTITVRATDVSQEYCGSVVTSTACEIVEPKFYALRAEVVTAGEGTNVGTYDNVITQCKIFEGENDVTEYFNNINYVNGTITILPRQLEITVQSQEKVYNGLEQQCDSYYISKGSLAPNHYFVNARLQGGITNVGSAVTTFAFDAICDTLDEGQTDLVSNYQISTVDGTITVTQRQVYIAPVSFESVYNAQEVGANEWQYVDLSAILKEYQLASGQTISVSFTGGGMLSGTYQTTVQVVAVYDALGGVVDINNYNFVTQTGEIVITPRALTISTGDLSWTYDSVARSSADFELINSEDLVGGDQMNFVSAVEYVDAGTYENQVILEFVSLDGIDVSSCYSPTFTGTITIHAREIDIETQSATKTYDGIILECGEYLIIESTADDYGLIDGHKLETSYKSSIINAGTADNILKFAVVDADGNYVKAGNYNIVLQKVGTLTVEKRNATIKAEDVDVIYDGEYHKAVYGVSLSTGADEGLIDGEIALIDTQVFEKDACEYFENAITAVTEVLGGSVDNYNFTFDSSGQFRIAKRRIVIKPQDGEKQYDGKPLNVTVGETTLGTSLANGDSIKIVSSSSLTNVGTITDNTVLEVVGIYSASGEDVTANYEFNLDECEQGALTVKKIEIAIMPINLTYTYMGAEVETYVTRAKIQGALLPEHSISYNLGISGYTATANGAPHEIFVESFAISDGANELPYTVVTDELGNVVYEFDVYNVRLESGSLTIKKKIITIKSESKEVIFDGNEQTDIIISSNNQTDCALSQGSMLASGEMIEFTDFENSISYEEYVSGTTSKENVIADGIRIFDENTLVDTTANYQIIKQQGMLEIR